MLRRVLHSTWFIGGLAVLLLCVAVYSITEARKEVRDTRNSQACTIHLTNAEKTALLGFLNSAQATSTRINALRNQDVSPNDPRIIKTTALYLKDLQKFKQTLQPVKNCP